MLPERALLIQNAGLSGNKSFGLAGSRSVAASETGTARLSDQRFSGGGSRWMARSNRRQEGFFRRLLPALTHTADSESAHFCASFARRNGHNLRELN